MQGLAGLPRSATGGVESHSTSCPAMCLLDNQMAFLVPFLGKGSSWTAHAQQVSDSYGVRVDFCEHTVSMRLLQQPGHDAGKRAVLAWKRDVVLPQLELRFQDQSVKWTLRHTAGVQPGTPWNGLHRAFLNFAQSIILTKRMWAHARVWFYVSLTWCFPFPIFDSSQPLVTTLPTCPWCSGSGRDVGICGQLQLERPPEALTKAVDETVMKKRFLFVGQIMYLTWKRCR